LSSIILSWDEASAKLLILQYVRKRELLDKQRISLKRKDKL
jgi:hypothetical protein